MDIKPSGSVPSRRMPAESFTGTVWQDPIIEAPGAGAHPRRLGAVRAEARAPPGTPTRSARPCTSSPASAGCSCGASRCAKSAPATRSGSRPAKSTGTAPGRTPTMVHIALQEALDGKHVTWLEHVTDEQYGAKVGA